MHGVGSLCYWPVARPDTLGCVTDFTDIYRPTEEHEAFRAAVREVCDAKVAPNAADFQAPHIPEEYEGVGADALATVIVIEEVARACASSSLIPAVNKLASLAWIREGSDALKQTYLPPL